MQIEHLLYESESTYIDFKEEQYKFTNSTDAQKSELLKDILAFTNSWRRQTAFILTGVREVAGSKAEVVGISESIDDSQIQQFVNSKTNRPIEFRYYEVTLEAKLVGVFEIPEQVRPVYLHRRYGPLDPQKVYLRRGSATDTALPEEIARMGDQQREVATPEFSLDFSGPSGNLTAGQVHFRGVLTVVESPKTLPDYPIPSDSAGVRAVQNAIFSGFGSGNRDYFRNFANYWMIRLAVLPVTLRLKNSGQSTLYKLKSDFQIPNDSIAVLDNQITRPQRTSANGGGLFLAGMIPEFSSSSFSPATHVFSGIENEDQTAYDMYFYSKEIYPGQTIELGTLYFVFYGSKIISVNVDVFGENLPVPKKFTFELNVEVHTVRITNSELIELALSEN